MTPTLFRALILFSVATGLAGGFIDSLFPFLLPEALSAAWDKEPPPSLLIENLWLLAAVLGPWLIASIVSTLGLFFFWHWVRPFAIVVAVLSLAVSPLFGPALTSGWSSALLEASFLTWGAVLALAYCSPLSQRFVHSEGSGGR
jgi:MFS family permease